MNTPSLACLLLGFMIVAFCVCVHMRATDTHFAHLGLLLTGPKLFKEPSSKSNKPIIHNAISHCCLAGKVNEPHKNSILEASIKVSHLSFHVEEGYL